jgi:hypothetical protein
VLAVGAVTARGGVVAVALAEPLAEPVLAARIERPLISDDLPFQPYHEAVGLPLDEAERLVHDVEAAALEHAQTAFSALLAELPSSRDEIVGVGVVSRPPAPERSIAESLRSHTWLHEGEGNLYREAVLQAAESLGIDALPVLDSDLPTAEELIARIGRTTHRPWRRLEKDAVRAAFVILQQACA